MKMPVPSNTTGATTTAGTSTEKGEEQRDPIAEAVRKATEGRTEFGGAEEATADETDDQQDETTDDEKSTDETTSDDTAADEGDDSKQDDDQGDDAGGMTADDFDDLRPGQQMNVPLRSVRPEDRDYVRRVKANLSRAAQAAADARRNGENTTERRTPKEPEKKTYTRDELFEMSQEGPEGFERASKIMLEQALPALLEERGIRPLSPQEQQAALVDNAIDIAIENKYAELSDPKFRKDVGEELADDDVLHRRMQRAIENNDADALSMVIEKAADRVRSKRYKQTEAARNKQKVEKETKTAKENGSVAATSTTRSTGTSTKPKGPQTVEDSVAGAIKQVGGNAFT
jgi:hypothetical protein